MRLTNTRQKINDYLNSKNLNPDGFEAYLQTRITTSLNKNIFAMALGEKLNDVENINVYFNPYDGTMAFQDKETGEVEQQKFYKFITGDNFKINMNLYDDGSNFQLKEKQFKNENIKNKLKEAGAFDVRFLDQAKKLYGERNAVPMNFSYLFNESLYVDRSDAAIDIAIKRNISHDNIDDVYSETVNLALMQRCFMNGEYAGEHKNPFAALDDISKLIDIRMKVYFKNPGTIGEIVSDDFRALNQADPCILLVDEKYDRILYSGDSVIGATNILLKEFNNKYHSYGTDKLKTTMTDSKSYNESIQKIVTYDYIRQQMDVLKDYIMTYENSATIREEEAAKEFPDSIDTLRDNLWEAREKVFKELSIEKIPGTNETEFDLACEVLDNYESFVSEKGYIRKEEVDEVIEDAKLTYEETMEESADYIEKDELC